MKLKGNFKRICKFSIICIAGGLFFYGQISILEERNVPLIQETDNLYEASIAEPTITWINLDGIYGFNKVQCLAFQEEFLLWYQINDLEELVTVEVNNEIWDVIQENVHIVSFYCICNNDFYIEVLYKEEHGKSEYTFQVVSELSNESLTETLHDEVAKEEESQGIFFDTSIEGEEEANKNSDVAFQESAVGVVHLNDPQNFLTSKEIKTLIKVTTCFLEQEKEYRRNLTVDVATKEEEVTKIYLLFETPRLDNAFLCVSEVNEEYTVAWER